MEPRFYAELLEPTGLADENLPDQWDIEAWPELTERLAAVFRTRTRDEWTAVFAGSDACVAPVLRMSEAPWDPHQAARGTFTTVAGVTQPAPAPRFSRTPGAVDRPAVAPGVHTDEVLAELGFSAERIAALHRSAAIDGPGRS